MTHARSAITLKTIRGLARLEKRTAEGRHSPTLLAHGFASARARQYPPDFISRRDEYLSDWAAETRAGRLNPPSVRELLNDKLLFSQFLARNRLIQRAPIHHGEIFDGRVSWRAPRTPSPLVVKPRWGAGGQGVRIFSGPTEVALAIMAGELTGAFVVQERVDQHPLLARVYPGALNTIRILAVRQRAGAPVHLAAAAHRFGRLGTGAVDSASQGGAVAQIDMGSGALSSLVMTKGSGRVDVPEHPDTGLPVDGFVVPFWTDAKQLADELMRAIPEGLYVGWDIAITPMGPVVIEGNSNPNPGLLQWHGPSLFKSAKSARVFAELGVISARQYRRLSRLIETEVP